MRALHFFLPLLLGVSLHAGENSTCYLFKQIDLVVDTTYLKELNSNERSVSYYLYSDPMYSGSLWCYPRKGKIDLCHDTEGKFSLKYDKGAVYLVPEYIGVGKEVMYHGEPDLDRKIIEHEQPIKGVKVPCQPHEG